MRIKDHDRTILLFASIEEKIKSTLCAVVFLGFVICFLEGLNTIERKGKAVLHFQKIQ
jgi:hypothetical protein